MLVFNPPKTPQEARDVVAERELRQQLQEAELKGDVRSIAALRKQYRDLPPGSKTLLLVTNKSELLDDADHQALEALERAFSPLRSDEEYERAMKRADRVGDQEQADALRREAYQGLNRRVLEHRRQHEEKVAALLSRLRTRYPDIYDRPPMQRIEVKRGPNVGADGYASRNPILERPIRGAPYRP